jgi:membrane protease YdiL (CAAX protease family)
MERKSITGKWPKFPNAFDFIAMAMWVFLSQILASRLCVMCGLELPDISLANSADDQVSLWAQLSMAQSLAVIYPVAMTLSVAGLLLYRRLRGGTRKIADCSIKGFDPSLLLNSFVLMLALQIAIEPLTELMPEVQTTIGRGFFTILVSVILAPIFEELICRGVVLESFRSKYGIFAAWIWSSLFFGVIHAQLTAIFSATILGFVLGYVYLRSRSIFSAIILHALNNGLALALMAFGLNESSFREIIPSTEIYWIVWASALLISIGGAAIMVRNLRKI